MSYKKKKRSDFKIIPRLKGGIQQLKDGEGVLFDPKGLRHTFVCCDCGLAHDVFFDVMEDDEIAMRFYRAERVTAAIRRHGKPELIRSGVGKWKMIRKKEH